MGRIGSNDMNSGVRILKIVFVLVDMMGTWVYAYKWCVSQTSNAIFRFKYPLINCDVISLKKLF